MKRLLLIVLPLFLSVGYSLGEIGNDSLDIEISYVTGFGYKDGGIHFGQNSVGLLTLSGIKIKNMKNKEIRYMTVEVKPYNKVNDLLSPSIGNSEFRVTGPIKYNEEHIFRQSSWGTYYDGFITKIKVRVTSIEYMDGEIKNNPSPYFTTDREQNKMTKQTMDKFTIQFILGTIVTTILFSVIL